VAAPRRSRPNPLISEPDRVSAVVRATAVRRSRIHADPQFARFTNAAIAERTVGFTVDPQPGRDGWWRVGWIDDEITAVELDVWFDPSARRLGLSERQSRITEARAPSEDPIIFDGERKRWIYRDTRQPVPSELLQRICHQ
jgi:hypothetical protein